jgi:hypothetical protein
MTALELERPRWRVTVHRRDFGVTASAAATGLGELTEASSRRLEQQLNAAALFTCSIPGDSAGALAVQELTTELMAWRWDDTAGDWALMFRGIVAQSQDTISENGVHTVNLTAHDYLAMLSRRYVTAPSGVTYTQQDQDTIAADLLARALRGTTSSGQNMTPGAQLQLAVQRVNPDGTPRTPLSGTLRDRTYEGSKSIGDALAELAAVVGGFDLDVLPAADSAGTDYLRIFYSPAGPPYQGRNRPDLALVYGGSVGSVSRSVNSTAYANYQRVLGAGDTTAGAPQTYAEKWNTDANDVTRAPVGLWQATENASDVSQQPTLDQKAAGDLASSGALVPAYTLGITPDWWTPGAPAMGDTVPLVIRKGRLDVSTTVRILGVNYAIGDDGQEDIEVTVGRPAVDLTAMFREVRRDVDALARR